MASSPAKPSYKWWESDDKTKRLYTELLAEKIAKSPKKSGSTLVRSASSCSDLRSRLEALEGKGTPPASPVKRSTSIRSLTSLEETGSIQQSPRKYTFETVTMDTLAKYEYIKSPKKKPLGSTPSLSSTSLSSLSSSPSPAPSSGSDEEYDKKIANWKTYERSSSSSSKEDDSPRNITKSWSFQGYDKNARDQERWNSLGKGKSNDRDKNPTTPTRGGLPPKSTPQDPDKRKSSPMFMLMTSSSKPELKSFGGKSYDTGTGSPARKERQYSKLTEVPEYGSSSSGESLDDRSSDSSDSGRATERAISRGKGDRAYRTPKSERDCLVTVKESDNNNNMSVNDTKAIQNNNSNKATSKAPKPVQSDEEEMDINQISKKFQALCEEVEQLEFKMSEFASDIQKLKRSIGIKDKEGVNTEIGSPKHHFRHAFTLAAGKDLLSERATARALLMRQYSSPTKSPRNISKLLKDTGIDKEMAEVSITKSRFPTFN